MYHCLHFLDEMAQPSRGWLFAWWNAERNGNQISCRSNNLIIALSDTSLKDLAEYYTKFYVPMEISQGPTRLKTLFLWKSRHHFPEVFWVILKAQRLWIFSGFKHWRLLYCRCEATRTLFCYSRMQAKAEEDLLGTCHLWQSGNSKLLWQVLPRKDRDLFHLIYIIKNVKVKSQWTKKRILPSCKRGVGKTGPRWAPC